MGSVLRAITATSIGLAGTALLVRDRAIEAEHRYPPLGRFVTTRGVRLHYIDRGRGPPVLLLHGNGAMINDLVISGIVDDLAREHRVIAFDRPGFGYSQRPRGVTWTASAQAALLADALALLGLDRVRVFGHSWGTLVAIALAVEHRSRVASLVLASGYYFPTPRADTVLFSPPSVPVVGDVIRETVGMPIGALLAPPLIEKMFAPQTVTERFKREFPVALALRPSQIRAFSEESSTMVDEARRMAPFYSSITCPTIILAGDLDRIVKPDHASRLQEVIASSRAEIAPGVGHMIHHVEPDRVCGAIRTYG